MQNMEEVKKSGSEAQNIDELHFLKNVFKEHSASVTCDSLGFITDVSEAFCVLSQYSKDELIGADLIDINSGFDFIVDFDDSWQNLNNGNVWKVEIKNTRKDGTYYWAETTFIPYIDSSKEIQYFLVLYNEIGAKKVIEEQVSAFRIESEMPNEGQPVYNPNILSTVLDRVSDAIVALDRDWKYTYMNSKAAEIFNVNQKAIIGKHIWTEFPEGIGQPFYKAYHKALEEQTYIYLEEYYPPYQLWFENHIYPSNDGLTIYFKDVTERKNAQYEILKEKNLSDSIINSLPGVFYLYDKDGKFKRWNKNFEEVSGYSSEEVARMHPLDFFDQKDNKLLAEKINQVFTVGKAEVEADFVLKNKSKIPYFFNGYLVIFDSTEYLMGVGINIEEKRKVEIAYLDSTEKYKYLFDNNPAVIIIWDIESFAINEVNELAVDLYGYTREEFLKMTVIDLRPKEDKAKIRNFSKKMMTNDEYKVRRTWRHLKKNGDVMYMDITSHRIDYNGRKAILSLAKDITEQIVAENNLRESYEDIRRLNAHLQTIREEERTYIAREIHDELGQQLTGLKMDASWLIKKVDPKEITQLEKLTDMINLIDDTVKDIRRISSDLRPGILDDLGLLAALEWQSSEFEKRTGITCVLKSENAINLVEKNIAIGIFRIFQEALTNITRHAHASIVHANIVQKNKCLYFIIQDDGIGFDVKEVKSKKTLGLTGMRERAHMFNGSLNIKSTIGKGTTLTLSVPIILEN